MKSLKNYKYKVFDKECKLIGEIDKVMQAISHYDVMKQRNKIDKGLSKTNKQTQRKTLTK